MRPQVLPEERHRLAEVRGHPAVAEEIEQVDGGGAGQQGPDDGGVRGAAEERGQPRQGGGVRENGSNDPRAFGAGQRGKGLPLQQLARGDEKRDARQHGHVEEQGAGRKTARLNARQHTLKRKGASADKLSVLESKTPL